MFLQPRETNSQEGQQTMSSMKGIPITWMLLDSQSTIDVFCVAEYVNPIIIPTLSSLCRPPSYLSCRLAEIQKILVMGEWLGESCGDQC